ncbi:hypothetical protein MKL09_08820 [Methylobacterium sp. J-048]|uniref:hypothetical protein n=1 Tax=Methylobacterium sp. J-048 TaxID=2836635 RepID=UPI001FBB4CEC|nr:hypothetical protein [Methylobacterium sp. J-048]MCJ2056656.1 hypothetical protein [Methylobacterium sp. J-048]
MTPHPITHRGSHPSSVEDLRPATAVPGSGPTRAAANSAARTLLHTGDPRP